MTTAERFGESMEDAADGRPLNRALLSWMALHAFEGRPDEGVMHEFFGASAVLDKAEEAQQAAAQHLLAAFGSEPYPTDEGAGRSDVLR